MRCFARVAFIFLLLALPRTVAGEEPEQELGLWVPIHIEGDVYEHRLGASFDLQARSALYPPDYDQLIVRTAGYVRFSKEYTAWLGVSYEPILVPEVQQQGNVWEQFRAENEISKSPWILLTNRPRLEEFIIEGRPGCLVRFRYLLRLDVELTDKWRGIVSDQPFFDLNSVRNGPQAGFFENRAFLGLDRQLDDEGEVRLEFGYMNRYLGPKAGLLANRMQHFLVVGLKVTFR